MWSLIGLLVAIVVAFTIIIFDYSNRVIDQKNLLALSRENEVLRKELKKYDGLAQELNISMADLEKYDIKLRIHSGLELINSDIRKMGIGGTENDTSYAVLSPDIKGEIVSVSASLQQLLAEAKFQRQSFEDIIKHLREKEYLRTHTPSITPVGGWFMSGYGMRIDPFTGYLRMHEGLDIAAPPGTPIIAPAAGIVTSVKLKEGYGLTVEIDHGYGLKTFYAHCLSSQCQIGQDIKRGDVIATVGETGRTTGPHVHYEVRVAGAPVSPNQYIIDAAVITD